MNAKEVIEQGIVTDIRSLVIETWKSKKETMSEELLKDGGLTAALLRILATSEKVRDTLLNSREDFPNRAKHNTLIAKVRLAV